MRLIPKISLASKCRMVFGLSVLLIVFATLFLPWKWSNSLSLEADKVRAEKAAVAAQSVVDLQSPDWSAANAELAERWPTLVQRFDLGGVPHPRLVSVADEEELKRAAPHGFLIESMAIFRQRPQDVYQWKVKTDEDDATTMRLAVAVRAAAPSAEAGSLRGIIDVSVPVHTEFLTQSIIVYILSGASGCALAILVFYLVTQRLFLSPVRKLRRVADQVSNGDLAVRSQVATGDEFQDLGEAFNQMLSHLQATQTELRTINRSLDVRLGELAETNVALFEANRLKNEFLAIVSHELRTPLSSIIGFAELVRDAVQHPPSDLRRPIRYANNILISARMLVDMINDLLDLAKIEAGKLELHVSDFDASEVCRDLLDLVRPLAEKKGIELAVAVPESMTLMRSDSGRIKQILYNLLSNAIKFTPEGGRVGLTAERVEGSGFRVQGSGTDSRKNETDEDRDDGILHLSVSDSGPGIPEEQRETIFEKFRQLDSSVTREYEGTGLGLAITRELVHLLGGRIDVDSEVGKGSTFTVELPFRVPADIRPTPISLT